MAVSNFLENAILNHTLRNVALPSPSTVYVGLFLSNPTDNDSGTEVSGQGYQRQAITFGSPSNGAISNSEEIAFPVAESDWGTISHLGIYNARTGGNLFYHGPFTVAKTIQTGDQFIIRIGDLDITID